MPKGIALKVGGAAYGAVKSRMGDSTDDSSKDSVRDQRGADLISSGARDNSVSDNVKLDINVNGKVIKADNEVKINVNGDKISVNGEELKGKELELNIKDNRDNAPNIAEMTVKISALVDGGVKINGKDFKADELRVSFNEGKIKVNGQEIDNAAADDNKGSIEKGGAADKGSDSAEDRAISAEDRAIKDLTGEGRDLKIVDNLSNVELINNPDDKDALNGSGDKSGIKRGNEDDLEGLHESGDKLKLDGDILEKNELKESRDDVSAATDSIVPVVGLGGGMMVGDLPDHTEGDKDSKGSTADKLMQEDVAEVKEKYEEIERISEEINEAKNEANGIQENAQDSLEFNESRQIDDSVDNQDNRSGGAESEKASDKLHEMQEDVAEVKEKYEEIERISEEINEAKNEANGIQENAQDSLEFNESRQIDDSVDNQDNRSGGAESEKASDKLHEMQEDVAEVKEKYEEIERISGSIDGEDAGLSRNIEGGILVSEGLVDDNNIEDSDVSESSKDNGTVEGNEGGEEEVKIDDKDDNLEEELDKTHEGVADDKKT
ncbi:hypothetical protein Cyrtocomes_00311 [Candidatus Cyrtobacter comes]|uniref:Uncharacterized protein n=1 Tax=Candidatus Cyrtobacter comes TaxID=675776 RepID=A0ABU5L7C6_9RICK|nr:hypothetical protein [Candidatus Cyrtobacter comes]